MSLQKIDLLISLVTDTAARISQELGFEKPGSPDHGQKT
jgi:hypothetical protein